MTDFSRTLIVDISLPANDPPNKMYKYLCDASSALSLSGGTIIVEQGIYEIDGITTGKYTVEIPSNVTIISHGATIEVTGNVPVFKNTNYTSGYNERITISGFKIVVNCAEEYESNVIDMKNTKNSIIENIHISSDPENEYGVFPGDPTTDNETLFPAVAIKLEGDPAADCSGNIIRQCTVAGFGNSIGEGIADNRYGIGILIKKGERNTIKNNFVSEAKIGCIVERGNYNKIIGNVFRDMVETIYTLFRPHINAGGIVVRSREGDNTDYTVIMGNIIYNCISHGIYLSGVDSCTVQGNISHHNGYYTQGGIEVRHGIRIAYQTLMNTICGNVFTENAASGMQLSGSGDGIPKHNSVFGNSFFNNSYFGIILSEEPEECFVDNNMITGNMCHGNNSYSMGCDYTEEFNYQICLSENALNADNVIADNLTS